MAADQQPNAPVAPVHLEYTPPARYDGMPFQVIERTDILGRTDSALRKRSGFHQLILCTSGRGSHNVDFESVHCEPGTLVRIHPGQVSRFVPNPPFEALMVVWPVDSQRITPGASPWYPGSNVATRWQLDAPLFHRVRSWIDELEASQLDYDHSPTHRALLQSMLTTTLLRLELELPHADAEPLTLPEAYRAYRKVMEERLYERPTVGDLAAEIGYSTRTIDRTCNDVSGQTARQVLDDRVVLELRRLLIHTDRPISQIAADFGFYDASNFSKFVKRHTGMTPAALRRVQLTPRVRAVAM